MGLTVTASASPLRVSAANGSQHSSRRGGGASQLRTRWPRGYAEHTETRKPGLSASCALAGPSSRSDWASRLEAGLPTRTRRSPGIGNQCLDPPFLTRELDIRCRGTFPMNPALRVGSFEVGSGARWCVLPSGEGHVPPSPCGRPSPAALREVSHKCQDKQKDRLLASGALAGLPHAVTVLRCYRFFGLVLRLDRSPGGLRTVTDPPSACQASTMVTSRLTMYSPVSRATPSE